MATTLSEGLSKVSFLCDDLQFGYFSTLQITRFLNDAQFEVQKRLLQAGQNYYLTCVQTTLTIGQADYALPSDTLHTHRLEMIIQGLGTSNELTQPLRPITLNQQDVYPFTQGSPQGYYLRKAKLVLVPNPDTNYVLRLSYSYRVAPLVNLSDAFDCPEQFMEWVVILAAIDCFIKDGRDMSALMAKKEFYEELLKQESTSRSQDGPRMVRVTGDGGFGVLF